jgi:ABC-type molybdate transport system permease subunit
MSGRTVLQALLLLLLLLLLKDGCCCCGESLGLLVCIKRSRCLGLTAAAAAAVGHLFVSGMALATMFVTLPFIVRELIPTLEQMDLAQEEAAKTLGANPLQVGSTAAAAAAATVPRTSCPCLMFGGKGTASRQLLLAVQQTQLHLALGIE